MASSKLDSLASVAVIVAATAVLASTFRSGAERLDAGAQTTFIADWESVVPHGIRTEDSLRPVTLIEFADFECAFCARHHPEIRKLMTEFAGQVDFVHVHSPLPQHRFAIPAARAAECAVEQGRFPQMQDALYAYQDSLGFFSWHRYAEIAGVPDSAQFAECIAHPRSLVRVDSGQALSARLSIPGTPTFLVNGHVVAGGGPDSLRSLIRSALEAAQR